MMRPAWRMLSSASFSAAVILAAASCTTSRPPRSTQSPEFFASPDSSLRNLPFAEAVRAGDVLFVSGQIGSAPGTLTLVPGGVGPESKQALENIQHILQRHGSSLDQVVKCSVFLADMKDWPAFNVIYREYFAGHFPARSAFGASGLALGARVEIECTAFSPPSPR